MAVFRFSKQPSEQIVVTVDFATSRFNGTEAASSQTTTATLVSDGSSATSTVIDSSSQTAGVVTIVTKAGSDGSDYKITTLLTTDEGNIYESDVIMKVRAR